MGEQVTADMERLLGPEHPDTLTAQAELAESYWSAGRIGEAIAIGEQVAADREPADGPPARPRPPRHPDRLGQPGRLVLVGGAHE